MLPKRRRLRKGPEHPPGVEPTSVELEKIGNEAGSAHSVDTAEEVHPDNEPLKGKGIKEAAHPITKLYGKQKGKEKCEQPKQPRKSAPKKKDDTEEELIEVVASPQEPQDRGSRKSAAKKKGEDEVTNTTQSAGQASEKEAGESEAFALDKATKGKKSIAKKRGADEDKPTADCAAIAKSEALEEKSGEDADCKLDEEASTTSNKKLSPKKRGSNIKFKSLKRLLQEAKQKDQVLPGLETEMPSNQDDLEAEKVAQTEVAEDPLVKLESSDRKSVV